MSLLSLLLTGVQAITKIGKSVRNYSSNTSKATRLKNPETTSEKSKIRDQQITYKKDLGHTAFKPLGMRYATKQDIESYLAPEKSIEQEEMIYQNAIKEISRLESRLKLAQDSTLEQAIKFEQSEGIQTEREYANLRALYSKSKETNQALKFAYKELDQLIENSSKEFREKLKTYQRVSRGDLVDKSIAEMPLTAALQSLTGKHSHDPENLRVGYKDIRVPLSKTLDPNYKPTFKNKKSVIDEILDGLSKDILTANQENRTVRMYRSNYQPKKGQIIPINYAAKLLQAA
jgi:hypothetical protein